MIELFEKTFFNSYDVVQEEINLSASEISPWLITEPSRAKVPEEPKTTTIIRKTVITTQL